MRKRAVRLTKHIGRTPVEAICTACQVVFKAPMSELHSVERAAAAIQQQFNRHKCATPPEPSEDRP